MALYINTIKSLYPIRILKMNDCDFEAPQKDIRDSKRETVLFHHVILDVSSGIRDDYLLSFFLVHSPVEGIMTAFCDFEYNHKRYYQWFHEQARLIKFIRIILVKL